MTEKTHVTPYDSNIGRVINIRQSLFKCLVAPSPDKCVGCSAHGDPSLCADINAGTKCYEGEVFVLQHTTPAFVQKWMGYFINSKGELDCMVWDRNPGHLHHAFLVNVPVPRAVQEDYLTRPTCLMLDKFGNPRE